MLEKKNRIRLNKEFDHVFKTGQSFYVKGLGVKSAEILSKDSRFGFLVGLKVDKRAVVRNRIKRQLRAVVRAEKPLLKDFKEIIIISLPVIKEMSFLDIEKNLKIAFKKLSLYD